VIAVAMRNENEISRDFLDVDVFGQRIRTNEWVKEKPLASGFDRKTGVAVVGEFHAKEMCGGIFARQEKPIAARAFKCLVLADSFGIDG
jgi:hypothetical protein